MIYPATIGIVGGGQLGKMLVLAAKKMGFMVIVTDPTPQSPAGQVADRELTGDYKDEKVTRKLAKLSDVITIDAEFVNDKVLSSIEKSGKPVHPSSKTISIIKDKLKQKTFLRKNRIPTADFIQVKTKKDVEKAIKKFGLPVVLKARFDAYDGKGNFVINRESDIDSGLEKLEGRKLYVEKFVPFVKELAIMVARTPKGNIASYPVVETIHVDNVCDTVISPAKISSKASKNSTLLAKKTMRKLKGAGVFGLEMFLTKGDKVLINEIAPRVHNSGHYTIEAAVTSQFEQHIRAITGLPLGSTAQIPKVAVMKNILGTAQGSGFPKGLENALKIPEVSYHLYGKKETRTGRKMGHITVVGDSVEACLTKANNARRLLKI
ncbi:MAG: Phosphoribosylaminoimidazole carboxylase ATPase subunit [Candidatus Levybacteria bacterium GW2011_GWA2_40_8]|nr:MAG: Phosphoribosylaminoimidazole carboxylase ATPase subunit [Candidatus Levybacteria bacterium GW2011_GWA2_40_8]